MYDVEDRPCCEASQADSELSTFCVPGLASPAVSDVSKFSLQCVLRSASAFSFPPSEFRVWAPTLSNNVCAFAWWECLSAWPDVGRNHGLSEVAQTPEREGAAIV